MVQGYRAGEGPVGMESHILRPEAVVAQQIPVYDNGVEKEIIQ